MVGNASKTMSFTELCNTIQEIALAEEHLAKERGVTRAKHAMSTVDANLS